MPDIIEVKTENTTPTEKAQKKTIFKTYLVVWYIVGLIETLLGFRFLLKAFAANPNTGFVSFIYSLSGPFMLPFQGIFKTPAESGYVLETATLVAMAVYVVLAYIVTELLHILKPVSSDVVDQTMDVK